MGIKTIKKYLKIYRVLLKYSLIQSTAYRASFFVEVLVELGYQIMFIIFFRVLFGHITEIAGWSYYEILFLAGLNVFFSEVLWGMVFVFGLSRLPEDIKNGSVDIALLKPLNPLFNLTLSKPYFTSLVAAPLGLYLMGYSAAQLHRAISITDIFFGTVIFCCGMVIAYSVSVILSSVSFRFLNIASFPQIIERTLDVYTRNPHTLYKGSLRIILFFIVPMVFVSSIPSSTILRGVEFQYVFLGLGLAAIFLCAAILTWNRMIRYYSSASS
jgi:ABC-2 type transport system permease protein